MNWKHLLLLPTCLIQVAISVHAQTTKLPDFDQGRLWVSPLAVLTTGIHAGYILQESSDFLGADGVRLEVNIWDRKGRAYMLWRENRSSPTNEQAFRELGLGLANLGSLGSRNTELGLGVGALQHTSLGAILAARWSGIGDEERDDADDGHVGYSC